MAVGRTYGKGWCKCCRPKKHKSWTRAYKRAERQIVQKYISSYR